MIFVSQKNPVYASQSEMGSCILSPNFSMRFLTNDFKFHIKRAEISSFRGFGANLHWALDKQNA